MNGEFRQDKVTRRWVIYAPSRGKRPRDFQRGDQRETPPPYQPDCPFCPGHEDRLPPVIDQIDDDDGWRVRVVSNKYPALTPDGSPERDIRGIYLAAGAYGRHEVLIEDPRHNHQLGQMTQAEIEAVVTMYSRRFQVLAADERLQIVIIFRNHGLKAGTSLVHPHSQIIASGLAPQYVRWRESEAQSFYDTWGRCVMCDVLENEQNDGRRVVRDNEHFLAFVPWAAQAPFEVWIAPKRHQADFGEMKTEEISGLADALGRVLNLYIHKLGDPDYNFVIHTATRYKSGEPQLHWFLQILPRTGTKAGFEIGSGMNINPSIPEQDADFLNGKTND
jgi:UDPglucose--hexose-1-phosphate uridylyltransferase